MTLGVGAGDEPAGAALDPTAGLTQRQITARLGERPADPQNAGPVLDDAVKTVTLTDLAVLWAGLQVVAPTVNPLKQVESLRVNPRLNQGDPGLLTGRLVKEGAVLDDEAGIWDRLEDRRP